MKKKINFKSQGQRGDIGEYKIYRMLPNQYTQTVGPFVFLDYAPLVLHAAEEPRMVVNGNGWDDSDYFGDCYHQKFLNYD